MYRFVTHATMNEDLFLDSTCLTCKVVFGAFVFGVRHLVLLLTAETEMTSIFP